MIVMFLPQSTSNTTSFVMWCQSCPEWTGTSSGQVSNGILVSVLSIILYYLIVKTGRVLSICHAKFTYCPCRQTFAGWTDPRQKVSPPKVNAILNPLNAKAYECFALALFHRTGLPELHDPVRLLQFRNQMIATFLMRMEDIEDALGDKDMILTHVTKCANEVGITKAKHLVWGKLILCINESS